MDFFVDMNVSAVLVAAVVAFIVGFLWYGPLFGNTWIRLMEIPDAKVKEMKAQGMGPMLPRMLAGFVQQVVVAAVLGYLASLTGASMIAEIMVLAAWIWFGFVATLLLNTVLWEGRKFQLYLFNVVYHIVVLLLMAAVLGWLA